MADLVLRASQRSAQGPPPDTSQAGFLDWVGGNCGNVMFEDAVESMLKHPRVVRWSDFLASTPEEWSDVDRIVIPCANQIGPHTDLGDLAAALERVDLPIVAVGIGGQASSLLDEAVPVTAGTLRWLRAIGARRPNEAVANIATRGRWSQRLLAELGFESLALSCPSVALGGPSRRERGPSRERASVAVAAGHTGWSKLLEVERSLVALLASASGLASYVLQSDEVMFMAGADAASTEFFRHTVMPLAGAVDAEAFLRRTRVCFTDAASWVDFLASFDLVLGCRFHGVMAGALAGALPLVLADDARVWELALAAGVPVMAPEQLLVCDMEDLVLSIRHLSRTGDERRRMSSHRLRQFLDANGATLSEPFGECPSSIEECHLAREPGPQGPGECELHGRLEVVSVDRLSGWAACRSHPNEPALVGVTGLGAAPRVVRALSYRSDIASSLSSSGFSGFSFAPIHAWSITDIGMVDIYGRRVSPDA